MAPSLHYNRIIFNANSAGTGDFLVFTAVTGYRTPATAGVADETVVSYTAETADRTQWETGQGTYDAGTTTVRRTTVRENSSGTTAIIDFATAPIVRLDFHKQDIPQDFFVDARDFGYVGDYTTDDSDAIQAAIDYAFAAGKTEVRISGPYARITKTIWLDPPANMRAGSPLSPTLFSFSMALIGGEGLGSDTQDGVTFYPFKSDGSAYFDYPAIVVGSGQGMRVAGITVLGSGSIYSNTYHEDSVGIALSGGAGGSSRTLIERCYVANCHVGFQTGWQSDGLCDSNTFFKCSAHSCRTGWFLTQAQNYICEVISCSGSSCTVSILSGRGKSVNVYGGNFSFAGANSGYFDMASTSALSLVSNVTAGDYLARFTSVLTMPAIPFIENAFTDGIEPVYTAYTVETESFGYVPLDFVSYDAGTNTITLEFNVDWVLSQYGFNFDFTTTDLEAEIQACTLLLTAERVTTFKGPGFHVYGAHIENPNVVTCILDTSAGTNGDRLASLENIFCNFSPTQDLEDYKRKLQSSWPILTLNSGGARIVGGQFNHAEGFAPWLINCRNGNDFWMENAAINGANIQVAQNGRSIDNTTAIYQSTAKLAGHWVDTPAFMPFHPPSSHAGVNWVRGSRGAYDTLGCLPMPGIAPEISPAQYTSLTAAAPITADDPAELPIILGHQIYRVCDWDSSEGSDGPLVVSDHEFYSYGQDLTIDWSYKGVSHCVYLSDLSLMFPGLKIGLDNGGGTQWYIVTGVYPDGGYTAPPRVGYITICLATDGQPMFHAVGTKTVTYTGSTIYQEVYAFSAAGGGGGTAAGSDTQVQFNDSSSFGGDAGLVYNKTTNALTVGGNLTLDATGSSTGSPRTFGVDNFAAGLAARWFFGDTNNTIQCAYADRMQISSYHGLEIRGALAASAPSFAAGSGASDPCATFYKPNTEVTIALVDSAGANPAHLTTDGSDALALRRGATVQRFNVYNTFSDLSNYERGTIDWATSSNVLLIGSQAAGTGTVRDVAIVKGANTFFTSATTTVGSLPAAGVVGRRHFVTDATVTTFASVVAGTGGNPVPVYDDGTNWRIG